MRIPTAADRFAALAERVPVDDYNFEHFRTRYLVRDARRTINRRGIAPGDAAPDFELPRAGGDSLRLSDLRGRPVLLHFGSIS
jgi:hypothetical protein